MPASTPGFAVPASAVADIGGSMSNEGRGLRTLVDSANEPSNSDASGSPQPERVDSNKTMNAVFFVGMGPTESER